jgi:uncharacterized protein YqcC (DUF446 family)
MNSPDLQEPTPTQASLRAALVEIEAALLKAKLGTAPPSAQALASVEPFCFDTLEFHAWLQWVFIPRMLDVLERDLPLVAPCAIAPLAEYRFAEHSNLNTTELLALIAAFDAEVNRYFGFPPNPA